MTRDKFLIYGMIATLGLAGWSFEKSETQGSRIEGTTSKLSSVVSKQSQDREDATLKNVEARKQDCEGSNSVRAALRIGVQQGQKEIPLLLSLVPALNTKKVLEINDREVARQLKSYEPVDCEAYAIRALPPTEANKVTLREEQAQIKRQQVQIEKLVAAGHAANVKSAKSRVVTVSQRCELTEYELAEASKPKVRLKLAGSLAGCHEQLTDLKAEAKALSGSQ